MRQTREILRQKFVLSRPHRDIARSLGVSSGTVSLALTRARRAELTWADVEQLSDEELERQLYPAVILAVERVEPDCAWIHRERHRPGVTLELLHHEYLEEHPNGLRYTAFCDRYRAWLRRRGIFMRQVHVAGDKVFVDYSGKKPHLVDVDNRGSTGGGALRRRARSVELYVRGGDRVAARARLDREPRANI